MHCVALVVRCPLVTLRLPLAMLVRCCDLLPGAVCVWYVWEWHAVASAGADASLLRGAACSPVGMGCLGQCRLLRDELIKLWHGPLCLLLSSCQFRVPKGFGERLSGHEVWGKDVLERHHCLLSTAGSFSAPPPLLHGLHVRPSFA